jgi:asparaginyl-tRNA synthetase
MDNTRFNVRSILAGEAPKDAPVTVRGWVRTRRDSKAGISFVHLSDGSAFHPVQVVAPNTLPNYADEVLRITSGCAVEATGLIVPSPAKGQPFEMQANAIKVIGWVDNPDTYPIQPKPHTMEFLREVAHLRPRTNVIGAATRVRHTLAQAIHRFFDENGFFWVNTPIITSSDAEGAGALFRVSTLDLANLPRTPQGKIDFAQDFFGREAFLTVSGQLNVEAYCLALTKVYTFGPTFRAENSNTSRHLAEFWMIEPEIAFADLSDDATLAERLLKYTFEALLKERHEDLAFFDERVEKGLVAKLEGIVASDFVRMDYGEAIKVLEGEGEVRVSGALGRRPAVGARALSHREVRQEARGRDALPEGHQGVLYAGERRRKDRRRHGRAGARHRRDHRRQPARGAARHARCTDDATRNRPGALRLVPRPAPLRHGTARRLRPRLRAHARLRHRAFQRARRDPVPAHSGACEVLRCRATACAARFHRCGG